MSGAFDLSKIFEEKSSQPDNSEPTFTIKHYTRFCVQGTFFVTTFYATSIVANMHEICR